MTEIFKTRKIREKKNTPQKRRVVGTVRKIHRAQPTQQTRKKVENKQEVDLRSEQIRKPEEQKQRSYKQNSNQQNNRSRQSNRRISSNRNFKKQEDTSKKDMFNKPGDNNLRIIPLGGCEEVGRNMTIFEYKNDIVIIDMGLQFPEEDMPGIDYIIPNTEYLKGKEKNVKAVIFTHGHMDHIGAAPILLEKLGNPLIVGSKLTVHMIKGRMEDYKKGSSKNIKSKLVNSFNYKLKFGNFGLKLFPVAHSIMEAMGIILETPNGTVIHPGDWKVDDKMQGGKTGYEYLSKIKKPSILMLESLGVAYKKPPVPEEEMYKNLEKLIIEAPGRVIIGTFASNVDRVKVILEMAEKYGKTVAVDGFSMKTNIQIAKKLGIVKFDLRQLIKIEKTLDLPDKKVVIMCTGAQGEESAVFNRIANGVHRSIKFKKSDTVIFSSSVIPGNERTVQRVKDLIYRQSDNVIHSEIMDVHSGGHATAGEVADMIRAIKPTYFIPVYANHYMLKEAAKLAKGIGYDNKHILIPDNGSVMEFSKTEGKILDKKVEASPVFVDGLGISNLQNIVFRDRQILAQEGMVVVIATMTKRGGKLIHNPDIISRGFVYLKENKELINQARNKIRKIVEERNTKEVDADFLKNKIRNDIGQFLFSKTGKRPMVLPVVIEV
ncbi:MAG: ribonuclease J [Patescibacteria group bacterium]